MDDEAFERIATRARADGYAERSSDLEPRSSDTIAMPIRSGKRVLATFGITYFRSAMKRDHSGKAQAEAAHSASSADIGFLSPKSVNRAALIEAMRSTVAQIEARLL